MAYTDSGPGPFEPAEINKVYRALYLNPVPTSDPTALTVKSNGETQSISIAAGSTFPGKLTIVSVDAGNIADIKGFLP